MSRTRRSGGRGGRRSGGRRPPTPPSEPVELVLHGLSHGAEAVGRRPDGKVCFVAHALPGERVRVRVENEHKSWSRGRLLEVLDASPERVEPPCPYARPGVCGGCALQHARPAHQAELLRQVVIDQLERIGRIPDPPVMPTRRPHAGDGLGYRNRARFAVDPAGRLGFHRQGTHDTHDVVPIDRCPLLSDAAHATRVEAGDDWPGVDSVTVRAGDDGAGLIEVVPGEGLLPTVPHGERPIALVDALGGTHALRGEPTVRYEVGGDAFTVSATSFFQPSSAAAEMLVEEVLAGVDVAVGDRVLDLYSGVGLFSRALAAAGAEVTAIEGSRSSVADARRNCADLPVRVVQDDVEGAVSAMAAMAAMAATTATTATAATGAGGEPDHERLAAVVLDPPRRGAGPDVCTHLAQLGPARIVYVACDPAALGRDAKTLTGTGYRLVRAVPVDQFTHTGHIETVATFLRL